jgi:hypothetical protein
MKTKLILPLLATLMVLSATMFVVSCGTIERELSTPTGTTNAPPLATQLQAGAAIVAANPEIPYSALIAALMSLAATGAAAYASFHASKAATASATAVANATAVGPLPDVSKLP